MNRNIRVATKAALDLGAISVSWEETRRHCIGTALMPCGVKARLTVSQGPIDEYKVKGWTRQQINRAIKGIRT
jgi:hypothetical protein